MCIYLDVILVVVVSTNVVTYSFQNSDILDTSVSGFDVLKPFMNGRWDRFIVVFIVAAIADCW